MPKLAPDGAVAVAMDVMEALAATAVLAATAEAKLGITRVEGVEQAAMAEAVEAEVAVLITISQIKI